MATGIPTDSVDRVMDFIDDLWTGVETVVVAFIEMLWNLLVDIFVDLTPALAFSLVICMWLYMFHTKFIATR